MSNLDRDDPPLAITTPLRVGIDFQQPQSYLAKAPTQLLAATLGITIDWLPMRARPLADPAAEMVGDSRGARHRRFRATYFERDLQRYAEAQGITLGDVRRSADSTLAGLGLLLARRHDAGDAYVDLMFDGYWRDGIDIENESVIREVLERAGAPGTTFAPAGLRPEYDAVLADWREAKAVDAPAYLVGDEVFIGRAHLPMIEWLYRGRAGAPPV
jgi:2-hydroxychromene-2-carboxylate isomerase